MWVVVVAVVILSVLHIILGLMSICLGVASSTQAQIWLAHSVSPIWSGGFFVITGILGFACAKKRSAYMIMCFTAFSIVSLVTAIVSIQLLRLGLVNHTTDGQTYQKDNKDILILIALGVAGTEILLCLISSFVSCQLARAAKTELQQKKNGAFYVQQSDFDSLCRKNNPDEDNQHPNSEEEGNQHPNRDEENQHPTTHEASTSSVYATAVVNPSFCGSSSMYREDEHGRRLDDNGLPFDPTYAST